MEVFLYRKGADEIEEGFTKDDLPALLDDASNLVWVDLQGETEEQAEAARIVLSEVFGFHHLTIEDCLEVRNQPKVEAFENYLFFIVHGVKNETNPANFVTKELDGFLGSNFVVTFHVERFNSILRVKEQIRSNVFACRRGAAYLLHQILDQLVDLYMPVVDDFDKEINLLEDRVFALRRGNTVVLESIMDLRRAVARMKRISSRQLDVLHRLSLGEFEQIPPSLLPFYRDVYDHLLRISDLSESYRDLVAGLFDIHFSVTASRTNEVTKVLAIFSAIMLPLSLIAGIYGMNFENMPETKTENGYYYTLGFMLIIGLALLYYFWRKGWIFEGNHSDRAARKEAKNLNRKR